MFYVKILYKSIPDKSVPDFLFLINPDICEKLLIPLINAKSF